MKNVDRANGAVFCFSRHQMTRARAYGIMFLTFFSEGMDSDAAMTAIGKSEGICGKLQVCREKKDNYEEGCINGEES